MVKIEGNTFIVTGGCGGIGGAVAKDLVSRGANIIVFDVVPSEKGDGIIKSLASGASGKAVYMQTDIADDAVCGKTVAAALEHAKASGSKLVGLVHCAGIALRRPWSQKFADTIEGFGKMLHVNTFGTYVVNAHVADAINSQYAEEDEKRRKELTPNAKYPPRVEEERGTILNFASIAGHESTGRTLGYGPTKTAVLGMTKCTFPSFFRTLISRAYA